jgi:DedD protein
MGLFSFLSKNKQGGASGEAEFYSRADSDAKPRKRRQTKTASKQMDDEEPLDPVLPEKKRARRRLVGAVALVLAMIIGLPMLLDSEPKPVADDIAIQIPSRDKPPAPDTSVPAMVTPPAAASAAASVPASSSSVAASASLGPREQIVNLPPPAEVKPRPTDTAAVDKPADKPTAVKPEKPADKPADKLSDKDKQTAKADAVKHDDDARAQAILNGQNADTRPADARKGGKFVVQVAALTSKDKINELQGKLSEAGFKPMLQTVPTDAGPTTRVRVGPFASKEEAESAQAKLTKLGLSGKLLPL